MGPDSARTAPFQVDIMKTQEGISMGTWIRPSPQRTASVAHSLVCANIGFELSDPDLFASADIPISAVGRYEDELVKRDGA
jgi:hypothetical protein